ncbi:MAG: DUF3520 domain-containing protein [Akkermansiaceae bacterium]|nr:DUF3520 domain-containing protein [Akkermansiaceae bacterium]
MNHHPPIDSLDDESVEAHITAWVLGEASAFESAELERLCQKRPELEAFRRKMLGLHGLMIEAENVSADHSWKLPPSKRKAIDEIIAGNTQFPDKEQPEKQNHRTSRRAIWAIAACLTLTAVVWKLIDLPRKKVSEEIGNADFHSATASAKGETSRISEVRQNAPAPANPSNFKMQVSSPPVGGDADLRESKSRDLIAKQQPKKVNEAGSISDFSLDTPFANAEIDDALPKPSKSLAAEFQAAKGAMEIIPAPVSPPAEPPGMLMSSAPAGSASSDRDIRSRAMRKLESKDESLTATALADPPNSAVSLNIDESSLQRAKSLLEKGERPNPADIKVEQFYNVVDYGDPAPGKAEPVAVTIEQCAHPVAASGNLVRVALKVGVAEKVKVRVTFNPQRVGNYRRIGFEKDAQKTEDFHDGSAGVMIYQMVTLPQGSGEIGEVSMRFRDVASGEIVERSWPISHGEKTPSFDRATPSMQLAGLSILAAEKLRGGPLADKIDFEQLATPRAAVKEFYRNNESVTDMLQVIDLLE